METLWKNLHELSFEWKDFMESGQTIPAIWNKATGSKALWAQLPVDIKPESTTVIGGICSLFTHESELIRKRQLAFASTGEFYDWLSSWYPRFDQIHDAVGVPPKSVKAVVYVCEDSLFGRRVGKWTGLDQQELSTIFRTVHEQQGHPVMERWFKQHGYRGNFQVVYTSTLERELELGLRIFERVAGIKVSSRDRDKGKIRLMYTWLWKEILGLQGQVVIYEPLHHFLPSDIIPEFQDWMKNPLGSGQNRDMGGIGFFPFWSSQGSTRCLPYSCVPHLGNWSQFEVPNEEISFYAMNMFHGKREIAASEIKRRVACDLRHCYEGETA